MCGKLEPFSPHWWAQSIVDGTQEIFKTRKECLSWIKSWGGYIQMNNAFQITTAYRIEQLEKRLASLEASLSLLGQRVTSIDKVADRLVREKDINLS